DVDRRVALLDEEPDDLARAPAGPADDVQRVLVGGDLTAPTLDLGHRDVLGGGGVAGGPLVGLAHIERAGVGGHRVDTDGGYLRVVHDAHGARPPRQPRVRSGEIPRAQCVVARSAPAPVSERTSISAYFALLIVSVPPMKVPMIPSRNDSGIDTRPGLASGNRWKSTDLIIEVSAPETAGEKMIRPTDAISPP